MSDGGGGAGERRRRKTDVVGVKHQERLVGEITVRGGSAIPS